MCKETNSYYGFAYYYNKLIPLDFYKNLVTKINEYGNFYNVLDLACGSGTLCFLLKNETNNVTGLDLSQEMLMIAQDYNKSNHCGVQFINQDLHYLNISENSYDLITCTLDSLNYLESERTINEVFKKVSKALQSGGYFCFDILTQFYIDEIVSDYYQCEELGDFEYVWEVKKIDKDVIEHNLEIITDEESFKEMHLQFIYDFEQIEKYLSDYNLKIIKKELEYNELNDTEASRIYYFCIKE